MEQGYESDYEEDNILIGGKKQIKKKIKKQRKTKKKSDNYFKDSIYYNMSNFNQISKYILDHDINKSSEDKNLSKQIKKLELEIEHNLKSINKLDPNYKSIKIEASSKYENGKLNKQIEVVIDSDKLNNPITYKL